MSVQTTKRIAAGFAFIVVVTGVVEMTPVEAATFTVNSTADKPDAAPGNGVCAISAGVCTLRAAVQETNAMGGQDTIIMPAGTYIVTSRIQVQDSVDLLGANAATTIVSGASVRPLFDITPSAGSTPTDVSPENDGSLKLEYDSRFKALIDDLANVTQLQVDKARGLLRELLGKEFVLHPTTDGSARYLVAEVSGDYAGLLRLAVGKNKFGGGQGS